ncbi:MAG: hypothetical protein M3R27_06395, partial [Bacteroidota bacterium]|nr:hypothetical protein [Bacteroidota bacterium]
MKRFLLLFTALFLFVQSGFSQGNNCASATPFCTAVGSPFSFPNNTTTTAEVGPDYGCLFTQPNPAWFLINTTTAGTMNFNLSQVNGSGTGIDVDFIAYGPFTTTVNICNNLTAANIEDCSYSAAAVENMTLVASAADQYFMICITNYSGVAGTITFTQTGGSPADCSITCPSVTSGNGFLLSGGGNMPATVACTDPAFGLIASGNSPFGNPITPGIMISFNGNANTTNQINWFENGTFILCSGPAASGCGLPITPSANNDIQFSTMSPSATNLIQLCENNTAQPNMPYTIIDVSNGAVLSTGTWTDDGACQNITIPPGTLSGVASWSISPACVGCLVSTTDWGFTGFDPAAAGSGTYTICYSFDPPGTCPTYTYCQAITVTNPYNASWTPPAALCTNSGSVNLNTLVTGTAGGTWSGTGVSGNTFNPATSGAGTFNVTYSLGSGACSAAQVQTITVNAVPSMTSSATATICSGGTLNIPLTSSTPSTFTWIAANNVNT